MLAEKYAPELAAVMAKHVTDRAALDAMLHEMTQTKGAKANKHLRTAFQRLRAALTESPVEVVSEKPTKKKGEGAGQK